MAEMHKCSIFYTYRIYPYKCPLPIDPTPTPSQPLQSSSFWVLHPSQQPPALRFWDSEKKMRFSTSPIEYRL